MGSNRLNRLDEKDFYAWVKRSGYANELDFWSGLSGLSKGTLVDHMTTYLRSLGYTGSPDVQFRQFLKDQVGLISGREGTLYDMASEFYEGTYTASIASVPVGTRGIQFVPYEGFIMAGYYQ